MKSKSVLLTSLLAVAITGCSSNSDTIADLKQKIEKCTTTNAARDEKDAADQKKLTETLSKFDAKVAEFEKAYDALVKEKEATDNLVESQRDQIDGLRAQLKAFQTMPKPATRHNTASSSNPQPKLTVVPPAAVQQQPAQVVVQQPAAVVQQQPTVVQQPVVVQQQPAVVIQQPEIVQRQVSHVGDANEREILYAKCRALSARYGMALRGIRAGRYTLEYEERARISVEDARELGCRLRDSGIDYRYYGFY